MVTQAVISLVISFVVLAGWLWLVRYEMRRGRRLLLARFRFFIDRLLEVIYAWCSKRWRHFSRYMVKLNWYYSLHALLQTCLRLIVASFHYFEVMFENNRQRAKMLRAEKRKLRQEQTHLDKMVAHKKDVSLSPEEQKNLKEEKLRGD